MVLAIDPQYQDDIDRPLYKVDPARTRNNNSRRMGLAFAKRLVERHNGIFTVDSESGQGTCFT